MHRDKESLRFRVSQRKKGHKIYCRVIKSLLLCKARYIWLYIVIKSTMLRILIVRNIDYRCYYGVLLQFCYVIANNINRALCKPSKSNYLYRKNIKITNFHTITLHGNKTIANNPFGINHRRVWRSG
jgi:hypothetical protein